jgi:hypothetical protein
MSQLMQPQTQGNLSDFGLAIKDFATRRKAVLHFIRSQLRDGVDFGRIPGTDKRTLQKPGAEKLCDLFQLAAIPSIEEKVEQWEKDPPFFKFQIRVRLLHRPTGQMVAEGIGSANSLEGRYRWRWVSEDDLPKNLDKDNLVTRVLHTQRGTLRQFRVPNDDVATLHNTLLKMAEKRALVDAVLHATSSSDLFTEEIDDLDDPVPPEDQKKKSGKGLSGQEAQEFLKHQSSYRHLAQEIGLNTKLASVLAQRVIGRPIDSRFSADDWAALNACLEALRDQPVGDWTEAQLMEWLHAYLEGAESDAPF